MNVYEGRSANKGIKIGRIYVLREEEVTSSAKPSDSFFEIERYLKASDAVKEKIENLQEKAMKNNYREAADILTAQKLILEDEVFDSHV